MSVSSRPVTNNAMYMRHYATAAKLLSLTVTISLTITIYLYNDDARRY